jgi:hypothetical protein
MPTANIGIAANIGVYDSMELLLNLVWIALALAGFFVFAHGRRAFPQFAKTPYRNSMLALACALVLLFPVVSASDDLHPSQAVVEEASKRMQQALAPHQSVQSGPFVAMLPALLAVWLMLASAGSRFRSQVDCEVRMIDRVRTPCDGRSPPAF